MTNINSFIISCFCNSLVCRYLEYSLLRFQTSPPVRMYMGIKKESILFLKQIHF